MRATTTSTAAPLQGRRRRPFSSVITLALAAILALMAPRVATASSTTLLFDGVLRTTGGGPATDGTYTLTFSLYEAEKTGTPLWTETATLTTAAGQFSHALGSVKPLAAGALATKASLWIGVQVGQEPELPRQALHATLWALSAASAQTAAGLSCTGCVPVAALKITDNIDLGAFSLKAKNITAQAMTAQTVTAGGFVGDGSKLTGIALPVGACKTGLVVAGINADGSLKCVSTAGTLPSDGLDEISNKLLTTQFAETFSIPTADVGKAIPDNTGLELVSTITVGDVGLAEGDVEIDVQLANSNLGAVSLVLLPPDNKKVGLVLCDPCGKTDEKSLKTTFPAPTKPKTGDLSAWTGKSPKGTWNLRIKDTAFCVPQLDKVNCDVANGSDGKLLWWSLRFGVQSSKLVGVQGTLVLGSGGSPHTAAAAISASQSGQAALVAGYPALWTLVVPSWPAQKSVGTPGQMVYRTDLAKTFVLQGTEWREVLTAPMCGDGVRGGTEVCDTDDLNKKTCATEKGSGSNGTLACKADCAAFDTSKCSDPPYFSGSKILDGTGITKVNAWYGNPSQVWVLCYRRSDDGTSSSTFHSKCNNKGPTMTVIKNNLNQVYGGYAPISWTSKNGYTVTTGSFLYSVTNNTKFPYYKNSGNSMYDQVGYGPTWGGNHDLYVSGNMTSGSANPGYSHNCPMCPNTSCTACQNALAGSSSGWSITELEVWYRK